MVSKGGATWGLRKSTLREGLGRVWVRFAPWTKMDSKGNSIWLEKKFLNFVKNHVLSDILGDADWLTIPLSLHPPMHFGCPTSSTQWPLLGKRPWQGNKSLSSRSWIWNTGLVAALIIPGPSHYCQRCVLSPTTTDRGVNWSHLEPTIWKSWSMLGSGIIFLANYKVLERNFFPQRTCKLDKVTFFCTVVK